MMGREGKARHVAGSEIVADRLRSNTPSSLNVNVLDVDKMLGKREKQKYLIICFEC